MKSTKRLLCLLLCAAMTLSLLTACGGQGEETQPTTSTTEVTTAPTTVPETTVPETTIPETTVPEPTISPFVVDGAFAYSKEEFLTLLEQRLVDNNCPVYFEYNYERISPNDDNVLLVYYDVLSDSVSQERIASLDLWLNAQSGEILLIRIIYGSDDPAQFPLVRQFANVCVSIIDPTMETDIYTTVSNKGAFFVLDFINYYGTIRNEVAYILLTFDQSDGDSMFAPCDLQIQTKAYLEEDNPAYFNALAEWLEGL